MLLDKEKAQRGLVGIVTRSTEVSRLLAAIFANWKLDLTDDPAQSTVAFVEWGQAAPVSAERVIWLVPLPIDEPHLEIPLQLEILQRFAEQRLFGTCRRNLRIVLRHPAEIYLAGEQFAAEICSLSKRGARLSCDRPLEQGQKLELTLRFGAQRLVLASKVLYLLPTGDLTGKNRPEAGLLFDPVDNNRTVAMAQLIEALCLEVACRQAGIPRTAPATSWFAVPRMRSPLLSPDRRF